MTSQADSELVSRRILVAGAVLLVWALVLAVTVGGNTATVVVGVLGAVLLGAGLVIRYVRQ